VPGGVDAHTHLHLPLGAVAASDDFHTGTAAAAIGGTTTVIEYVTAYRGEQPLDALATWSALAEPAAIDYGFHMTFTEAVGERAVADCIERGVTSFKLYMAYPETLMVDDDVINRVVATGMAQCLGHDVEMARDGLQAIDRCLRAPPSVILMDIEMPRMNGLEATRHIRALQRRGALPPCRILATTSVDSGELRRACVAAGMDGYLMKPLCMSPLQSELRRVCVGSERER